jgi:hypothetical protein
VIDRKDEHGVRTPADTADAIDSNAMQHAVAAVDSGTGHTGEHDSSS